MEFKGSLCGSVIGVVGVDIETEWNLKEYDMGNV